MKIVRAKFWIDNKANEVQDKLSVMFASNMKGR